MESTTIVPSDEVVDIPVVGAPPHDENPNPPIIQQPLQRSERTRRPVVHDDFITYLNEDDYDLGKVKDPIFYKDAINTNQLTQWLEAVNDELKSMQINDVWELIELPNGYTPKEGIDYNETFSPVSRKESLRIVMALVAHNDLELHQMDVKTAFLNGDLHEDVYMTQPERFMVKGKEHMVYKLKRSIYGLKQASRQWSRKILGLSQIDKILKKYNMQNCSPTVALVVKGDKFGAYQCPNNKLEQEEMRLKPYASVVGRLTYTQVCTRHDIAYITGGPISWRSHKQELTTTSTMMAEYVACYHAASHAMLLRNVISRLNIVDSISRPLILYCDNSSAVRFSNSTSSTGTGLYLKTTYLYVREKVEDNSIVIEYISTHDMLADPLTKGLPPKLLLEHVTI
ncbi:retrovirus-related pol polyprotein from transposon TNT 1-94, partial [Tanacetum coccineum]